VLCESREKAIKRVEPPRCCVYHHKQKAHKQFAIRVVLGARVLRHRFLDHKNEATKHCAELGDQRKSLKYIQSLVEIGFLEEMEHQEAEDGEEGATELWRIARIQYSTTVRINLRNISTNSHHLTHTPTSIRYTISNPQDQQCHNSLQRHIPALDRICVQKLHTRSNNTGHGQGRCHGGLVLTFCINSTRA
jgi:hypothetical protein